MNKKFLSAILFGALMVTSTGTFVSCKDYDEDIDQINTELTNLKSALAALQSKVDAGKYVTNVAKNGEGITVSWSDGTSSNIASIKGDAVSVTIDPTTKNWLVDGVDTGVCAEGKAGANGEAAATPIFSIGEDGHLYVQYGEAAEKEDLGVSTGGIYIVENGPKVTLHAPNAEGEYKDIVLPKAASISNITVLGTVEREYLNWDDCYNPTVTLGVGQNKQGKDIEFNGKTYAKDALLSVAKSQIVAQINPTMADATVYDFYLTDSKGKSIFTLGTAKAHTSEGAISRAEATPNKGIYVLPVTIAAGTSYKDAVSTKQNVAYAVATKDAFDNEVLSQYAVHFDVDANATTTFNYSNYNRVQVNKAYDLTKLLNAENVVDVKFSFSKSQSAAVDAAQAVINGTEITGAVAQKSVFVTVEYMDLTGKVTKKEDAIQIYFIAATNESALSMEITPTGDPKKDFVTFDLTGISTYFESTDKTAGNYQIKDVKFTAAAKDKNTNTEYKKGDVAVGITKPAAVETKNAEKDATGYYKHTLTYTVDAAKVIPGTYEAVVTYYEQGNSEHTLTLTIVVNDPATAFEFQVLDAYFNADKTEATAYGTPNGTTINYNLYQLFNKATNEASANITFSEVVPATYKDAKDHEVKANAWLNGTDVTDNDVEWIADANIVVDRAALEESHHIFGGAYSARTITAKYQPYGNANLTPAKMTFDLTIKSEIFEGTIEYVKAVKNDEDDQTGWTAGDIKEVDGGKNATLALTEILANDVYGKAYNNAMKSVSMLDETRVADVKVVLADDNAKEYLKLSADNFANGAITISKKSENTAIVTPPTCTVQVKVTDKWNKVKTLDIQVKVIK